MMLKMPQISIVLISMYKAHEILMQVFVHGVVEHFKIHFIILINPVELFPRQLRYEILPDWLTGAEMSPVPHPG